MRPSNYEVDAYSFRQISDIGPALVNNFYNFLSSEPTLMAPLSEALEKLDIAYIPLEDASHTKHFGEWDIRPQPNTAEISAPCLKQILQTLGTYIKTYVRPQPLESNVRLDRFKPETIRDLSLGDLNNETNQATNNCMVYFSESTPRIVVNNQSRHSRPNQNNISNNVLNNRLPSHHFGRQEIIEKSYTIEHYTF